VPSAIWNASRPAPANQLTGQPAVERLHLGVDRTQGVQIGVIGSEAEHW
jgi:hypothetical protein